MEAFGLLQQDARILCVLRRAPELFERGGRVARPEAELSGNAERPGQPRVVPKLFENGDRVFQLPMLSWLS